MKSIMITGCSSGFGLDTAKHFLEQGFQVIATMRNPDKNVLPEAANLRILPLDVTNPQSIENAVKEAGKIDILVNNAGIGWLSPLEGTPPEIIKSLFETNTFGVMEVIRAVIPQMRERGEGTIVNVSSSTTLKALPLLPIYTASKAAVNAFTECLEIELEPFGIKTKLVLPGQAPGTNFASTARAKIAKNGGVFTPYMPLAEKVFAAHAQAANTEVTNSVDVVNAIWLAVTDPNCPFKIPAGADAVAISG